MSRETFIISRTDAIGDVVLTLPVAGVLRSLYPASRILLLGRSYTEAVVGCCEHIDGFLNWDEWQTLPAAEAARAMAATGADSIIHVFPRREIARMAWKARIKERIGTTNRIYHWRYCNVRVPLSRKNSPYHESQLNLRLLAPLGAKEGYTLPEIAGYYGLTRLPPLPASVASLLAADRFNLILHPKSRGNGREWGLDNFRQLIGLLPQERYKLFLTGTAAEGQLLEPLIREFPYLTNLTGQLTLGEFVAFIAAADGLVASGTGPLHLAAALGIHALGLFPPIRPIHPGRWAPIGARAKFFVKDKDCEACRRSMDCDCIREIAPRELIDYLESVSFPHPAGRPDRRPATGEPATGEPATGEPATGEPATGK
jgi:ADP-heptose:LPS heptosyltransferase